LYDSINCKGQPTLYRIKKLKEDCARETGRVDKMRDWETQVLAMKKRKNENERNREIETNK
jgi:hypothetical protein